MLWTQSLVQAKVYGKEYCFVFKGDGRLLLLLSWSPSHLHLNCFHLVPFKDDCIKSRTYLSMFFYYGKKLNIFSKNNLHIVFVFIQRSWGGPKVQYGTIHKRCCPFYNFLITPFSKIFYFYRWANDFDPFPHPLQIANVLYGGPLTFYNKDLTMLWDNP